MNQGSLKNMVLLKNLPSNLVEEAILILKSNKKMINLEKIEKNKEKNKGKEESQTVKEENDYIVKEAEMLIANYLNRVEEKKKAKTQNQKRMEQKCQRLKNYACMVSLIVLIETILLIIQ